MSKILSIDAKILKNTNGLVYLELSNASIVRTYISHMFRTNCKFIELKLSKPNTVEETKMRFILLNVCKISSNIILKTKLKSNPLCCYMGQHYNVFNQTLENFVGTNPKTYFKPIVLESIDDDSLLSLAEEISKDYINNIKELISTPYNLGG